MDIPLTPEAILEALRCVEDPELHQDVVSLGMIQDLSVSQGVVRLTLVLTTPACPLKAEMERRVRSAVEGLAGVSKVELTTTARVRTSIPSDRKGLPGVRNIIAVASGKGGVGKTTVSVNTAVALAKSGARVGLMDADIYGPNVPLMMGLKRLPPTENQKIIPAENFGVGVVSMGFLLEPDDPVIWRGPMLHGAVNQFLREVRWGELDYLLVDLPPGTGDVQLSLSQLIPLTGALVVTTPQDVALLDVRKSIAMFEKVSVPVLGLVENMSGFVCPHCQKSSDLFARGGGRCMAEALKIPFLGAIPLIGEVRLGGDAGSPVVVAHPDTSAAQALALVAQRLAAQTSLVAAQAAAPVASTKRTE